jgi:hypothetical protein
MSKDNNFDEEAYKSQNEQLNEMNYAPDEDIFVHQDHISLDENGLPIYEINSSEYEMEMDLDVPGSDYDNLQEQIGSEDEENNYWSLSDNDDDHEEYNEDIIK